MGRLRQELVPAQCSAFTVFARKWHSGTREYLSSQMSQDVFLLDAMGIGDGFEDGIQSSDPQRRMIGNGNSMMTRIVHLKDERGCLPDSRGDSRSACKAA